MRFRVVDEGALKQAVHNDKLQVALLNRLFDLLAHALCAEPIKHKTHDNDPQEEIHRRDQDEED